jgi:hypothetical protein
MPAWIASLVATALPKLLEWLWKLASKELQDYLAKERIREHVQAALKEYEAAVLKHDDLVEKGELTPQKAEEIKNEKIKIETDILNGVYRMPRK